MNSACSLLFAKTRIEFESNRLGSKPLSSTSINSRRTPWRTFYLHFQRYIRYLLGCRYLMVRLELLSTNRERFHRISWDFGLFESLQGKPLFIRLCMEPQHPGREWKFPKPQWPEESQALLQVEGGGHEICRLGGSHFMQNQISIQRSHSPHPKEYTSLRTIHPSICQHSFEGHSKPH